MSAAADPVDDPITHGQATTSALLAPSLALASCVRSYVTRSTVGAVLRPDQRYNHFPASPLCGIFWLIEGESVIVGRGAEVVHEPVPRLSVAGPHTVPMVSVNPGPVRAFMLGLLPQAFQAMTGLDLSTLVNRAGVDGTTRAWQPWPGGRRPRRGPAPPRPRPSWSRAGVGCAIRPYRARSAIATGPRLALKAGTSGVGKSLRQAERRVKQWAGLPMRELRRLGRAEESFFRVRDGDPSGSPGGRPDWAAVAVDSGYSDQAHLCREVRRIAGMSPADLKRAIDQDESFWTYRIWS
ncbi:MAG: AraC family transcriptional regulator [Rhodoferax sp.]|nr:AraC family transcriptional regulator [Rhodoferax sp.]